MVSRSIHTLLAVVFLLSLGDLAIGQGLRSPAFEPIEGVSQCWVSGFVQDRFNWDVAEFSRTVQFRREGTITDVGEENGMPDEYALDQNYPNPFNPATTIRYALPEQARGTLRVFSLLGEEVATLFDEAQEAGFRSVNFDASALASGAYFYRLTAGSFVDTRRMILVK